MIKKILVAVVISTLPVAVVAAAPITAVAATPAVSQYDADVSTILGNTNKERAAAGLPALTLDPQMSAVALESAKTQASTKTLGSNPNASSQIPAGWVSFGQAVSFGRAPAEVTAGFMASTNPRAHILSATHTATGIGIAYTSTGTPYYTQLFAGYKTSADNVAVTVPQNVRTTLLNNTSFTVAWDKPATVTGTLKNYTVKVTGMNYDKTFTTTSLNQAVTGLTAKNAYTVKVTANAVSGNQKFTKSASYTTTFTTTYTLTQTDVNKIVADVNAYRVTAGLKPLIVRADIATVASNWSKVMAKDKTRYHNPNLSAQMPAGYTASGENIANGLSVATVAQAWYDSPSHRANMLNPRFTHTGVGLAYDTNGKLYYTQDFGEYK